MRQGAKSGRRTVVVHVAPHCFEQRLAGFAVSKAVGNAVTRNRVRRRLRAIATDILPETPAGTGLVVRALAPAARASFSELSSDVSGACEQALTKAAR